MARFTFVLIALSASFSLWGCGGEQRREEPPKVEAEMVAPGAGKTRMTPKGVRIEPSGFGTILSAPPAEFEPPPPPDPIVGSGPRRPPTPVVSPELAHLIRLFPRALPQQPRIVMTTLEMPPLITETIILRDGCFRLAGKDEPLALFPPAALLFLDEEGYLTLGVAGDAPLMSARVGEPVSWQGSIREVTEPEVTEPLRKACGPRRVVRVSTGSAAVRQSMEDASTARSISQMYGVPYPEARRRIRECRVNFERRWAELRKQYGDREPPVELLPGPCHGPPPPPPVAKPSECPPGTTLQHGLCRDAKGFVVPVPPRPPF